MHQNTCKVNGVVGSFRNAKRTYGIRTLIPVVLRRGGLGDKVEEWIEKLHQMMKKMLYLTQRMTSGWETQMKTIYKYM